MPIDPVNTLAYRRARFATRLPLDRRYTASHFWLLEVAPHDGGSALRNSRRGCWATWSNTVFPSPTAIP